MAKAEHLAILAKGVETWNRWRRTPEAASPDLSEANLIVAHLVEADLHDTNLQRANLSRANLIAAKLLRSDLTEANLVAAGFYGSDLREAKVSGANFLAANFGDTILGDIDLSGAKNLESVYHQFPSTIDHRTLAKSGPLPLVFLRGCGLPDQFIEYLPSLFNQAIQFYSCFISYSTTDQEFVERLYADLQNKGVRCWFAAHDIQGGKKIHEQIDEAIHHYDRLLLILSEASIHSEWVKTEISKARKRETRENRRMLFPVRVVDFETLRQWECFDADTFKDSAREIREYFIPDFSNWKDHERYRMAFDRLIKDLKAEEQLAVST